jgi:ribosomal protein S18 acetylase RimI-like enzyme
MMLRDARPAERRDLEELQRRASLMWEEDRPYLLANPDTVELPLAHIAEGRVRVVEANGQALGFAVLLPRDGDAVLEGLFVEPEHWRRGIARLLVEDAAARAHAQSLTALEVVANGNALGFYKKLGFTVCGTAQTPLGPAKRLWRVLNPG